MLETTLDIQALKSCVLKDEYTVESVQVLDAGENSVFVLSSEHELKITAIMAKKKNKHFFIIMSFILNNIGD